MHNENNTSTNITELNEVKSDLQLLRRQLFSDDISKTKNRLWVYKEKLSEHETFNDFGFVVSIKISDYEAIIKEYDANVGNRLLKQVSDYMIGYMKEHHLKHEIVRYKDDNFLIFLHELNEEEVEEHIVNMQKSMSNYKFKYRSRMFMLSFNFAVMQYIENESFPSVLDQLDEKLFQNKL
jgi:GGDEF domain-containing protein